MINLKYKFKSIKQVGSDLVATYEIEQPNRYQIAREVIEEYVVIAKTARYLADNRIDEMLYWLDQQENK